MEAFDPGLHYGPNDAGISAITYIAVIIGIIIVPLIFSEIYTQVLKIIGKEKSE